MRGKLIYLGVVTIVSVVIYFFIRSDLPENWVKNEITKRVGGLIEIESVEGNLFTQLTLRGLKWGKLFEVNSINLRYNPISLIRRQIKEAKIISPYISFAQIKDKVRAFEGIRFPWIVQQFIIEKGNIEGIPYIDKVDNINLSGSMEKGRLKLNSGNASYKDASFSISKGAAEIDSNVIRLKDIFLKTESSKIVVSGEIGQDIMLLFDAPKISLNEWPVRVNQKINGELSVHLTIKRVNGSFSITGKAYVKNCEYEDYPIGNISADLTMKDGILSTEITEWTLKQGKAKGYARINLNDSMPAYSIELNGNGIDVSNFFPKLPTRLNGKIEIVGKGVEGKGTFSFKGKIGEEEFDKLDGNLLYNEGGVYITSLDAKGPRATAKIEGDLTKEKINLSLFIDNMDLSGLVDNVKGKAHIDMIVRGNTRNPDFLGTFYIRDGGVGRVNCTYLSGNIDLREIRNPKGKVEITSTQLILLGDTLETLNGEITASDTVIKYVFVGKGNITNLKISGNQQGNYFSIDNLTIVRNADTLSNIDSLTFTLSDKGIDVKKCQLLLDNGIFEATGYISKDKLDLILKGKELALESFVGKALDSFLEKEPKLAGRANFDLILKGSIRNPVMDFSSNIKRFSYEKTGIDEIEFSLSYREGVLNIGKCNIICGYDTSYIRGYLPLEIYPFGAKIPKGKLEIDVSFKNMEIGGLGVTSEFAELQEGKLSGDIKLRGTTDYPNLLGNATLHTNKLFAKLLGETFDSVDAYMEFDKNKIIITSFIARTEQSHVTGSGTIFLEPGSPITLDIKMDTEELRVRPIEDFEACINSDLHVHGEISSPTVEGNIFVEDALVMKPFEEWTIVPIVYKVNCDLNMLLPGKIWIKNRDAELELGGNMRVQRKGSNISLQGNMVVKRGHYYYLDRPFKIIEGRFEFGNLPELNPHINIKAETQVKYTITKGDTSLDTTYTINLDISGSLKEPQFRLYSNPPLSQQDIMALLSLNMTFSQKESFQSLRYTIPDRAMSYLLRTKILNEIENSIGLDALDIKPRLFSKEEGKEMRLTVGKYISKDLFVIYSHDLFSGYNKDEFKAEYRLWEDCFIVGERTEDDEYNVGLELKFRY